eukprot:4276878-Pleurochrysis_carterae.AAC.2
MARRARAVGFLSRCACARGCVCGGGRGGSMARIRQWDGETGCKYKDGENEVKLMEWTTAEDEAYFVGAKQAGGRVEMSVLSGAQASQRGNAHPLHFHFFARHWHCAARFASHERDAERVLPAYRGDGRLLEHERLVGRHHHVEKVALPAPACDSAARAWLQRSSHKSTARGHKRAHAGGGTHDSGVCTCDCLLARAGQACNVRCVNSRALGAQACLQCLLDAGIAICPCQALQWRVRRAGVHACAYAPKQELVRAGDSTCTNVYVRERVVCVRARVRVRACACACASACVRVRAFGGAVASSVPEVLQHGGAVGGGAVKDEHAHRRPRAKLAALGTGAGQAGQGMRVSGA